MKLVLEIDSNNAALSDRNFPVGDELARILHGFANQLHGQDMDSLNGFTERLRDSGGNVIGQAAVISQ